MLTGAEEKKKISKGEGLPCDQCFSQWVVDPILITEYVERSWEMYEFYTTEKLYSGTW